VPTGFDAFVAGRENLDARLPNSDKIIRKQPFFLEMSMRAAGESTLILSS